MSSSFCLGFELGSHIIKNQQPTELHMGDSALMIARELSSNPSDRIERWEKNAAEAEKVISEAEQNLARGVNEPNQGRAPLYQDDTTDKITKALELLKSLETDAADATHFEHTQAEEIKERVKDLHQRVMKIYMDYEKLPNLTQSERFACNNWENVIEEMQDRLSNKKFGPDLPSIECQVEEHNIFHSRIKALASHIADTDDKDQLSDLRLQYNKLLASSDARQRDLLSLRDYMLRCTIELYWMEQQTEDRINYDWSDANLDYPSRQRQYEKITSKYLESKKAAITLLCDDGERLLAANHPGKNVVQAHVEAVRADWQDYCCLLVCEKHHLSHMDNYHKYYKKARDAQELLTRLDTELTHKYNPAFKDMYQIQGLISDLDDLMGDIDNLEEEMKAIQTRSQQVSPLKLRREISQKPLPLEALCDFDTDEAKIILGEKYTLFTNHGINWEVKGPTDNRFSAPAVCFAILPTDTEAMLLSETLVNQQKYLKQTLYSQKDALLKHQEGLKNESPAVAEASPDQLCLQLMASLEKVISNLDKQEKAIYTCLRPPLQLNNAYQDSLARLQVLKDIEASVKKCECEKNSKVHEAEAFLSSHPKSSTAAQLFTKVNNADNKYTKVALLLECTRDKFLKSSKLEESLETARTLLSTYETTLASEQVTPSYLTSIERLQDNLSKMSSELQSQRVGISKAQENLRVLQSSCEKMMQKMQEHCPDIERQQAEVHKLRKRLDIISRQVDTRSKSLQRAKAAYNNYHNSYNELNEWISQLPNYDPQDTDDNQEINAKLTKQRDLLPEIVRKEYDLHNVLKNAQLYQQAVQDYENDVDQLRSVLDLEDDLLLEGRNRLESPAFKVKNEESIIEAKFMEIHAVNKQRLRNLEYVQSLFNQNLAAVKQPWKSQVCLEDGTEWKKQLKQNIKTVQGDAHLLEEEKPQDVTVKMDLFRKIPDLQLEEELHRAQQELSEEQRMTRDLRSKLELLHCKLRGLGAEKSGEAQQYVVKEVLHTEQDRKQEETLVRLRYELHGLQTRRTAMEKEITKLQRRLAIMTQGQSKDQTVIVQDDVQVRSEAELLESGHTGMKHRQQLEDELKQLQGNLKHLEEETETCEENVSAGELQMFEKDTDLKGKIDNLRRQYEDEKARRISLSKDKEDLLRKITALQIENSKGVTQGNTNNISLQHNAKNEASNLHIDVTEQQRKCTDFDFETQAVQDELNILRIRNPQSESNEIIKEVTEFKTHPEIEMEVERLRNEIAMNNSETEKADKEIFHLKDEIQRCKAKPQVEVEEVTKVVFQFCENPETKQELETLRRKLSDEQKKFLNLQNEKSAIEEEINFRKSCVLQVQDKISQQEIAKMKEDPLLTSQYQTLSQNTGNELKEREVFRDELNKLQCQQTDLDVQLEQERRARHRAETELLTLKLQMCDLEIKEKETDVVIQQDSQQENEYSLLRLQFEQEHNRRMLLEKEINELMQKQARLVKMAVPKKVVLSEQIQVERDGGTEMEIELLRKTLDEEINRRDELNQQLIDIKRKLSHTEFTNNKFSEELHFIQNKSDQLQVENQWLKNEIGKLNSEIQITAKETKDSTNLSPLNPENTKQVSLQKELSDLKNINNEKDKEIKQLQKSLSAAAVRKEHRESHLRRSVLVIEPVTYKELKPEEAYNQGLIDWALLVKLESQECDWEEISLRGPHGQSSVLHDKKSGKRFSIEDELNAGNITSSQVQQFRNNEINIQELGIMLSRSTSKSKEK